MSINIRLSRVCMCVLYISSYLQGHWLKFCGMRFSSTTGCKLFREFTETNNFGAVFIQCTSPRIQRYKKVSPSNCVILCLERSKKSVKSNEDRLMYDYSHRQRKQFQSVLRITAREIPLVIHGLTVSFVS